MQINGIGNNQIGNTYQNPNRMPNSASGKREDDEVSKRLEALGVKVELSFQQPPAPEQEVAKEATETEKPQESFSVLGWVKKIWEAGIAWLKSIWNDENAVAPDVVDAEMMSEEAVGEEENGQESRDVEVLVSEEGIEQSALNPMERPEVRERKFWEMSTEELVSERLRQEQSAQHLEAEHEYDQSDKFRTTGVPLHTSGMQDSYNRYGQHSKLGVEPSNNMTIRK